jgi:hypothetical protein
VRGGKAESFAGVKGVHEVDFVTLRRTNQFTQLDPQRFWVRLIPSLAVKRVILGSVNVRVHAALRSESERSAPLHKTPWRAEKSLDHAAALEA